MITPRLIGTAGAALAALGLAACSGSTGGHGSTDSTTGGRAGGASPSTRASGPPLYSPCTGAQKAAVPSGLAAKSCWALPDTDEASFAVLAGSQLWRMTGTQLTVSDASTGTLVTRIALRGEPQRLSGIVVDGKAEILVVGYQKTAASGTTTAKKRWIADGYASPATPGTSAKPVYTVPGSIDTDTDSSTADISFGTSSLVTGDALLTYGAAKFEKFTEPERLKVQGGGDMGGVSGYASLGPYGDLLIVPISDAAYIRGDDYRSLLGVAGVAASGRIAWDSTKILGGDPSAAGFSGPDLASAIIGGHVVTFTVPENGTGPAGAVSWYDATNGKAAHPVPSDLAGKRVVQDHPGVNGNNGTIVMSDDGKYLIATDSGTSGAAVLNVATGRLTHVSTEQVLTASVADGDTAYASSDGGAATVDLASGKATALPSGVVAPAQLTGQAALLDVSSGPDATTLLVGR